MLALCGLVFLLAGCGSPPAPIVPADEPAGVEELELEATKETGILRGIVVDEAIRPIAGVSIRMQTASGELAMQTTSGGLFGFDGLEPNTYIVHAEKAGFDATQVTATAVAGDDYPPFVKVLLQANASYQAPYVDVRHIAGFITCTGSPFAMCSIPNNYRPTACGTHPVICYDNVTDDSTLFWTDFEGNTSFLQAELVWKASSSFSQELGWNKVVGKGCHGIDGTNNATHGRSPQVASMVPPEIRVPGGETCTLYVGVSAGPPSEATCIPVQFPLLNYVCLGFAMQQSFDVYIHSFYGYLPPEGWTFTGNGAAPTPP